MGVNALRGVANFNPRSMIGKIYLGDNQTLLHTKYLSIGPYCFREENIFEVFPIISHGQFGHQGCDWQDLCR